VHRGLEYDLLLCPLQRLGQFGFFFGALGQVLCLRAAFIAVTSTCVCAAQEVNTRMEAQLAAARSAAAATGASGGGAEGVLKSRVLTLRAELDATRRERDSLRAQLHMLQQQQQQEQANATAAVPGPPRHPMRAAAGGRGQPGIHRSSSTPHTDPAPAGAAASGLLLPAALTSMTRL
jgi:hypothetical protein